MGSIFYPDFRDFIKALNNNKVRYLLVGGYAVIFYGYSRTTGDMDIWVDCTKENYQKLVLAFNEFKMPLFDMTEENFLQKEKFDVFRFGKKPVAIDIMTKMVDLEFSNCYEKTRFFQDEDLLLPVA